MQTKRQKARAKKQRQYENETSAQAEAIFAAFGDRDMLYPALLRLVGMITAEGLPHERGADLQSGLAYTFFEIERYAKQHVRKEKHLKRFAR